MSREGSGRVAIYKETGLDNCYTLECNYHSGVRMNHLPPKFNIMTNKGEAENNPVSDITSKIYAEGRPPPFTIEIFEDIGRAICISLLDYLDVNPVSRIPLSTYKNLGNIKGELLKITSGALIIIVPSKKAAGAGRKGVITLENNKKIEEEKFIASTTKRTKKKPKNTLRKSSSITSLVPPVVSKKTNITASLTTKKIPSNVKSNNEEMNAEESKTMNENRVSTSTIRMHPLVKRSMSSFEEKRHDKFMTINAPDGN